MAPIQKHYADYSVSFHVKETSIGYTWSYGSLLGNLLVKAEKLYGDRNKSYTLLGVEMVARQIGATPQVWYPGACEHIIVQITSMCEGHFGESVYQLAHEAIHCLFPSGGKNANFLEEGLAVHFALECAAEYQYYPELSEAYLEALNLVSPILDRDRNFIKMLRKREESLYRLTKEILLEVEPSISLDVAENLIRKF